MNLDISFKILWFHFSRDVSAALFITTPHAHPSGKSEVSFPKRALEFLCLSLSVSLQLIKAGWQTGGFSQRARTIMSCQRPYEGGFNHWLQNARWFNMTWRKWLHSDNPPLLTYIHGLSVFFMLLFSIHSAVKGRMSTGISGVEGTEKVCLLWIFLY